MSMYIHAIDMVYPLHMQCAGTIIARAHTHASALVLTYRQARKTHLNKVSGIVLCLVVVFSLVCFICIYNAVHPELVICYQMKG